MKFTVDFFKVSEKDKCPMINIDTDHSDQKDSFSYANIFGMYKTDNTQGHGIQVNDKSVEEPLLKMCDKISQAVYDYENRVKD